MYRMCLRAKKWRQGKEGENQCNKRHAVRVRLMWDLMIGQNERVCLSIVKKGSSVSGQRRARIAAVAETPPVIRLSLNIATVQ